MAAMMAFLNRDLAKAKTLLAGVPNRFASADSVRYLQAVMAYHEERYEDARIILLDLVKKSPIESHRVDALVVVLERQDRTDAAKKVICDAAKLIPFGRPLPRSIHRIANGLPLETRTFRERCVQ